MLFKEPYIIIDLETTGGHLLQDRITEIGLISVEADGTCSTFQTLVNPEQVIPPFISNMTGITNDMVADAPLFSDIADELLDKIQGKLFIAHSVRFDYGFLKNAFWRLGKTLNCRTLCTVRLSRRLYPQYYKHSLATLIERHQLNVSDRHRAMADADALNQFLIQAKNTLGETAFDDAVIQVLSCPDKPADMPEDLYLSLPDTPGAYRLLDQHQSLISMGATRNLQKALTEYYQQIDNTHPLPDQVDFESHISEFGAQLQTMLWRLSATPEQTIATPSVDVLHSITLRHEDEWLVPQIITLQDQDSLQGQQLYGLFRYPKEAKRALHGLAKAYHLCHRILGIEASTQKKGSPCAGYLQKDCKGACVGKVSAQAHNLQLLMALKQLSHQAWPYSGYLCIAEVNEASGETCKHYFKDWQYYGYRSDRLSTLSSESPVFHISLYRWLQSFLKKPWQDTVVKQVDFLPQ